jgi:TonB-dependent starch-binding outer membrane protein SusC
MQLTVHCKKPSLHLNTKWLILLLFSLLFSFGAFSQRITLSLKKASLEQAFREIESRIGQRFVYTTEMLEQGLPVTINVYKTSLQKTLSLIFEDQPLDFTIEESFIKIKYKPKPIPEEQKNIDIKGRILGETGIPLFGASVLVKGKKVATSTDNYGYFSLRNINVNDILVITFIGYKYKEIPVNGKTSFEIYLNVSVSPLDETVVIAYGKTTNRLNTGNITKVSGDEISKQSVSNPLAALQGRVPGMVISQTNGLPGSSFRIQIRGRNSIAQGSDPLFIIDGVPYAPGNSFLNQLSSAIGVTSSIPSFSSGLSPFSLINPSDIESIEVLKDADATAIYGSRGANGVILITTKKGKEGNTKVSLGLNAGWGKVGRSINMLHTNEYIQMRKEAFSNDGLTPTIDPSDPGYAPDLLIWDTTTYSDFNKLLIGGTAKTSQAHATLSGSSVNTQFLLGATYRYQSTVFPGDFGDKQGAFHLNVNHVSPGNKFHSTFSINYTSDKNNLLKSDLSMYLNLPPNLPPLRDSLGNLLWENKGVSYALGNPYSELLRKYSAQSENLVSNLQLAYQLLPKLNIKTSLGYNTLTVDETALNPAASYDPQLSVKGSSLFANTHSRSWIIEPQLEYTNRLANGKITVLVGTTFQEITNKINTMAGLDYANDFSLESIAAAGKVISNNTFGQYRYNALFGRMNYNYSDKYLLNVTGRKDGSSRFGPGKQLATFGAVGAGWIFKKEKIFDKLFSFLSYGKLRGSYGSSGNDQIGDYQYFDSWSSTPNPYQGIPGFTPTRLFNADYSWEVNRKLEGAIELGFLHDHLYFSTSYFRNRSSNQLVSYPLPIQTGFNSVNKNLQALIQNQGLELLMTCKTTFGKNFQWESSINFTSQKNKLVSFPGLSSSSYARNYVEGQSLAVLQGYHLLGVEPSTGIYLFEDINKDNAIKYQDDYITFGNTDPQYFGGFSNTLSFKNFEFSFLLEFRKQLGRNYLDAFSSYPPGMPYNQPYFILNRWQKTGDNTDAQRFLSNSGSPAYLAVTNLLLSDGVYSDASYIRSKNVGMTYSLPPKWLKKIAAEKASIYLQASNLFTITGYKGADPETQNFYALPPLRLIVTGLNITF